MTARREARRSFLQTCAAAALLTAAPPRAWSAADPSRVALVIGNDAYGAAPLNNAVNDARAMASLLADAGFDVDLRTNVDRAGMADGARAFAAAAARSDVRFVFFYYAGHGTQLDWRNFLLPVDARVNTAADLPAQCLEFGPLVRELAKAKGRTFVLVLDACRDNPFGGGWQPQQKGLSQFDAPPGSLLAFSTAPGSVAADGTGQASLYTENLVRELAVKGTRIEDALKRVRLAVRIASRGAQVPWESTSLETDVFLFPAAAAKLSEKALEEEFVRELATWNRVKGSARPEDWIAYLREFPSGKFSEIAQNRLNFFLRAEEERVAQAKPVIVASAPVPTPVPTPVPAPAAAPPPPPPTESTQAATARPAAPSGTGGAVRAQLEIRPGGPAPVLMRPSQNPNSAGTYPLGHRFTVGDEVVYAISPLVGGDRLPPLHWRVTRVDEAADIVEINDGAFVLDTMGGLYKWEDRLYDPRFQMEPAELAIGKTWSSRYRLTRGGFSIGGSYDHKIVARGMVRVPAGEFDAFAIEATGFGDDGRTLSSRAWVVPGFNFPLRMEFMVRLPRATSATGELREMVSCRQIRWTAV